MRLDQKQYEDKVLACWLGKNIGGTMGGPYELSRELLDVKGFSTPANVVLPNDDLDLQLVWLYAMERLGIQRINANVLGEMWLSYIVPRWNEYGICQANMRRGLMPPMSGDYDNDWQHSNGAWIRTEIWACAMPGMPDMAARYAIEDAMVDHGAGEGTYAAAFVAAMQSAAFVVEDFRKCIEIGLAAIPEDCRTAQSIRLVMDNYDCGIDWVTTRNAVLEHNMDIGDGWFEAPSNVAYAVLGMLYGEGEFKKSMLTAINCGDDTDCTAATVGATLGILGGMSRIPEDWMDHVGDDIVTISVNLADMVRYRIPKTCTELTQRVVALAPSVLYHWNQVSRQIPVVLGEGMEVPEGIGRQLQSLVTEKVRIELEELKPYSFRTEGGFIKAVLTLSAAPEIHPEGQLQIHITLKNNASFENMQHPLILRWLLPEGFSVSGKTAVLLNRYDRHGNGKAELDVTVTAGQTVQPENRLVLEITAPGRHTALYVPILLFGC